MDHEKQARSDATELKLKVLDDKLLRAQITEEEKLRPLNEQIERLMEELSAERLSREVSNPPLPDPTTSEPHQRRNVFLFRGRENGGAPRWGGQLLWAWRRAAIVVPH